MEYFKNFMKNCKKFHKKNWRNCSYGKFLRDFNQSLGIILRNFMGNLKKFFGQLYGNFKENLRKILWKIVRHFMKNFYFIKNSKEYKKFYFIL